MTKFINARLLLVFLAAILLPEIANNLSPAAAQILAPRFRQHIEDSIIGRCGCDTCNGLPGHIPAFNGPGNPDAFILSTRWSATAMSGGGLAQGDPTIITWSIVPDGTDTNADGGFVPSNLIAEFDNMFSEPNAGTPDITNRNWFALIDQALNRWGELSGIEYVYEPNDDGETNFGAGGVVGVRGDVRIGGFTIDGPGNVLAFNAFPDNGDMALDTTDGLYSNPNNNFVAMRNIIAHEAGHGLGFSHVEPLSPGFLMNPFINTAFDGPQLDDVLAAHRGYGDLNEKSNGFSGNESIANATDLGTVATDSTLVIGSDGASGTFVAGNDVDFVSVDDNSDIDFYRLNLAEPSVVSATVTPIGVSYMNGPQNGTPVLFEPSLSSDLAIAVFDSAGQLVEAADATSNGESEAVTGLFFPAGDFFVRVTGSDNNVQLYELEVASSSDLPDLSLALVADVPETISPNGGTAIQVEVTVFGEPPAPETANVFVDLGSGFQAFPMIQESDTLFTAIMPPSTCGEQVEFFFSIDSTAGSTFSLPDNAPTATFSTLSAFGIANTFEDDFESNLSWTVAGDASDGQWERAIPNNGDRGDPEEDIDDSGQGFCFVTDNGNIPDNNTDVDGGTTILTSPVMDASGDENSIALISYYRWYSNTFGNAPEADTFVVEISNDNGANWIELETVGPSGPEVSGGWIFRQFTISDFVAPTDQMQVRFIASDLGDGSVVEAGVDRVEVQLIDCTPDILLGDVNMDGAVNLLDVAPFVELISTGVFQAEADINGDGEVNLLDVGPFVDLLSN